MQQDTGGTTALTRRTLLQRTAAGAATAGLAGGLMSDAWAAPGRRRGRVVPLPSPGRVLADYQRMVDFGPRLPGYAAHDHFCDWLEEQFAGAGLDLIPCDEYDYDRWRPRRFGLDVMGGPRPERIRVATSFVRAKATPDEGVVGPLVLDDGGPAPGSVLLVDLTATTPTPGYKRLWRGPWPDLQPYADRGAAAVVFVVNTSFEELAGNWSPLTGPFQPIPALVVDRDTGRTLRERAVGRPPARLTLRAPVRKTRVRSITAVLPGQSDEVLVVDTHTDGQNFVEENGAVALVHLARHFASLPRSRRLRRTLVFAGWAGHMSGTLPEAPGWVAAHPDLVARAAAAVTIEHLGATEWEDSPVRGYRATGRNELYVISTTAGPASQFVTEGIVTFGLDNHVLAPGPGITVGSVFHKVGVPHVGGIAGPTYLLVVSDNGEMDKLDANLASRQTAFYADVIRRLDGVDRAALRAADASLGTDPMPTEDPSRPVRCRPEERRDDAED